MDAVLWLADTHHWAAVLRAGLPILVRLASKRHLSTLEFVGTSARESIPDSMVKDKDFLRARDLL